MPIKRVRGKAHSHRITPEAVEAFRAAEKHAQRYGDCIRGNPCRSSEPNRHCAECREHIDAIKLLDRLLGLKPWEAGPLDVETGDDADRHGSGVWADSVRQALQLRAELESNNAN